MANWADVHHAGDLLALVPEAAAAFALVQSRAARVDPGATSAGVPAAARWAEQFVLDASSTTDELREDLASALGEGLFDFVVATWATDMDDRASHALAQLAASPSRSEPPQEAAEGDLWSAVDSFLSQVARLDRLDAVTTEIVRLRGARANNCRLCKSLRNVDAVRAGADEEMLDSIDDYESSTLDASLKAALALTDAMLWTPAAWPRGVAAAVREHFSPEQAAELVFDVVRNGANRIAVALGVDAARVESGVEFFSVDSDGVLTYGLDEPSATARQ